MKCTASRERLPGRGAALSLAALLLLAGCGGASRDEASAAPTADSALTGSAQAPSVDTAMPEPIDTQPAEPSTADTQPTPAPTRNAETPAPSPRAKAETARVARAEQDTGTGRQDSAVRSTAVQDTASQDTATQDTAAAQDTVQTQTAQAPLRDPYHQAPRDTVSQEVYDGWKQYNLNCARCHGEDVLGTTIAPHLIMSLKPEGAINTKELFIQTVCAGRPEKGMPSWCALGMDMEKINQIYAYVKGRSEGKLHPGRPARQES